MSDAAAICRVCTGSPLRPFQSVDGRDYWRCPACEATLLDETQLPSADAERAEYALHENAAGDAGYRRHLARLLDPLLPKLAPASKGLDYGCGPGPVLAAMLREAGHDVALYDPFFHRDEAALERRYDFVACTEVVEHFHRPAHEFARLRALLRPGGWLGILTCFQTDDARFAGWHYRRDTTHVAFYREATFRHLAARHGWRCDVPAKDVVLMQRTD